MPIHMPHARTPGKISPPTSCAKPAGTVTSPLHLIAHRLAANLGVPFGVALAHAQAAGLGKEVVHG